MGLQTAHGGHVIADGITVPNQRWSANWRVRDTEVTQSDSGGGTLYFAVLQDNEWEFTAARDDTFFPEAVGLAPGDYPSEIKFKLGDGNQCDLLEGTLVTEVNPVNDNTNDVIRVTVRGKGGVVTPNQSIT